MAIKKVKIKNGNPIDINDSRISDVLMNVLTNIGNNILTNIDISITAFGISKFEIFCKANLGTDLPSTVSYDLVNYFVRKEIGKGLSTNDYTNDEKEKASNGQLAYERLSNGPEYNETKRAVVFPITSGAEYDSVKRSVSFETINY